MTDKKISQLTSATTPVAGTEVLPIVQSGSTVKVSVADLTVGRSISTAGASLDGAVVINETGANVDFRVEGDSDQNLLVVDASADRVGINIGTPAAKFDIVGAYDANAPSTSSLPILRVNEGGAVSLWVSGQAYTGAWIQAIQDDGTNNLKQLTLQPLGSLVKVGGASDLDISNGNLIVGTAAKGIDFSANTGAAGETSSLLDWYEEGTWTPSMTFATPGDFALGTPIVQIGKYTRIGRMVTCNFSLVTTPTWTTASGYLKITGLPFTSASGAASGYGCATFTNVTKANYTNYIYETEPADTFAYLTGSANNGGAASSVVAADMTTGVQTVLSGCIVYFV